MAKGRVDFQKGILCFQRVVKYIANTRIDTYAYSREVVLIALSFSKASNGSFWKVRPL